MVLCRNRTIRVFGEAPSGRTITASIHDHTASATAVKGKSEIFLPPFPPGGPHEMTVTDGETMLTYDDILFGDAYFAGGQSNIKMQPQNWIIS